MGAVLATLSHPSFLGEQERLAAFRSGSRRTPRAGEVVVVGDLHGEDAATERAVAAALEAGPPVAAVYSMGGGNTGIAAALAAAGRRAASRSSGTTSTPTTSPCCAPGCSRSCCTTTSGPTCARP